MLRHKVEQRQKTWHLCFFVANNNIIRRCVRCVVCSLWSLCPELGHKWHEGDTKCPRSQRL